MADLLNKVFGLDASVTTAKMPVPSLEDFISYVKSNNLARQERFFVNFPPGILDAVQPNMRLLCNNITLPGKTITNKTIRLNGLTERRAGTLDYGGENITLEFVIDSDYDVKNFFDKWMSLCISDREYGNEVGFYNDYAKKILLIAVMPAGLPGEKMLNYNLSSTPIVNGLNEIAGKTGYGSGALKKAIGFGLNKANNLIAKKKGELLNAIDRRVAGGGLGLIRDLFTDAENTALEVELEDCWPTSINPVPMSWGSPGVATLSVTFSYKKYKARYNNTYDEDIDLNIMTESGVPIDKQIPSDPAAREFYLWSRRDPNSLYNRRRNLNTSVKTP